MATSSSKERLRYRYGKCLNESVENPCSKAKSKEVQEIPARKDFVCSECGKPLRECPPPKKKNNTMLYAIIATVVVVAAVVVCVSLPSSDDSVPAMELTPATVVETPAETPAEAPQPETPAVEETAESGKVVEIAPEAPKVANGYGVLELSYGRYEGEIKDSKPHGHGKITYSKQQKIVSSKDYVANPGDVFEGDFRNGRVSGNMGYWYHDNGEVTAIKP